MRPTALRISVVLLLGIALVSVGMPTAAQAQVLTPTVLKDDFEAGLGRWSNVTGDNLNWTRMSTATPNLSTGPDVDHTPAPGAFYVFVNSATSGVGFPNKVAILQGPCVDLTSAAAGRFRFFYHMFGAAMGPLTLEAAANCGTSYTPIVSLPAGDKGNQWREGSADLAPYLGSRVALRFRAVTGSAATSDMALDDLEVTVTPRCNADTQCNDGLFCNGVETCNLTTSTCGAGSPPCGVSGITCEEANDRCRVAPVTILGPDDFQAGFGNWTNQTGDLMDWLRDANGTPTTSTGPTFDHTLNTAAGFYVYTEADGNLNRTAFLDSPCLDLANYTSATWSFFYHMQGAAMGRLEAQVAPNCGTTFNATSFVKIGNQGTTWMSGTVDLTSFAGQRVKLRFRGLTGSATTSDMALDDIRVTGVPRCASSGECTDGNTCTADVCTAGMCQSSALQGACNDGNACTQADTCQAGVCVGSSPVVCSASDACHDAGTCNTSTGQCTNPTGADGRSCPSGDLCRPATCQAGTCAVGPPRVCQPSGPCRVAGTCNPATGQCSETVSPNGASCTDGNACTQTDTCQGGVCIAGTAIVCTPSDGCHLAGTCNPTTGACSNPAVPDGTQCSDGVACTVDICQGGLCVARANCGPGQTCAPIVDRCEAPTCTTAASCNDNNPCTTETCGTDGRCAYTASGTCLATFPIVDDFQTGLGNYRNVTTGDQMDWTRLSGPTLSTSTGPDVDHTLGTGLNSGFYVYTEATNFTSRLALLEGPCVDLSRASTASVEFWYHMFGASMGPLTLEAAANCGTTYTALVSLPAGDQGNLWRRATADLAPFLGRSVRLRFRGMTGAAATSDMAIDDVRVSATLASACTSGAQCNDNNPCTADFCDAGRCSTVPVVGSCSDGNACTQNDMCQNGTCVGGAALTCTASDQCHTAGTCNAATGTCSNPAKTNGTTCNDGSQCTQTDTCQAGVCTGASSVMCPASDSCHSPSQCNPATGQCSASPALPDGTTCNDGSGCTVDSCQGGVCRGVSSCPSGQTCDMAANRCELVCTADSQCADVDPCTTDRCGPGGLCTHALDAGMCVGMFPVIQNFDAAPGFTSFVNVAGDEMDWTRKNGPTPSRAAGTGPAADHTTGTSTGFYVFTEADGNNGKTAILQGPCFRLDNATNAEWTFFYHRRGTTTVNGAPFVTVGPLRAEVAMDCGTVWTRPFERLSDEGDVWRAGRVDLTPFMGRSVKLRLVAQVGFAPLSDIAVDDIRVDTNVVLPPVLAPLPLPILQNPLLFNGTAKAGQRIELFLDGTSRGVVTAAANGTFSVSVSNVTAGSHAAWAQADEGGRKSFIAENEKRLFTYGETTDRDPDLSGTITTPTVLDPAVAYTVNNDLTVRANASLRIPAGTTLRFAADNRLTAEGSLVIEGTSASPVRLLPATGVADWNGVFITSSADSRLANVRIESAVEGVVVGAPAGMPAGFTTLTNLTIIAGAPVFGGDGVSFNAGSRGVLQNSRIQATVAGEGRGIVVRSDLVTIEDTEVTGLSGGVVIENSSPTLRRITATSNGVGVIFAGRSRALVTESRITGNQTGLFVESGGLRSELDPQVHASDLFGNAIAVSVAPFPGTDYTSVDFSGNWWGSTDPAQIATSIGDRGESNGYDRRPRVIFCPYLSAPRSEGGQPTPTGANLLCGRISDARTLVSGQTYRVLGGLVVEPAGALTIPAGTTLEFDPLPGTSGSRLEVAGRLDVLGTAASPAVFRSRSATPQPGDWGGISVRAAAQVMLRGARVEHPTLCVQARATATLDVVDSLLRQCGSDSFSAVDLGSATLTGSITGTRIEVAAGESGSPASAIEASALTSFTLRGNTIRGADIGIHVSSRGSPLIQANLLEQNRVGISIEASTSPVVNGSNRILRNVRGIDVLGGFVGETPANPVVTQNEISGNTEFNYRIAGIVTGGASLVYDASNNFWGLTDRFAIDATIFDRRQDPNLPDVQICPFLSALGGTPLPCADALPRTLTDLLITTNSQLTPGDPYVISGTVTIDRGAMLTVQPGTTVRFQPGAKLVINGSLVAQSPAQDIVFRSNAASPTPGSWQGVEVGASATAILIDGVTIQHAVTPISIPDIRAPQSFTVTRSVLRDFTSIGIQCGNTFFLTGCRGSGTISNNRFENFPATPQARVGTGIFFAGGATDNPAPTMSIASNTFRGLDGGIFLVASSPSITANLIEQNNVGVSIRFVSSPRITGNNRIVNNGVGIDRFAPDGAQPIVNGNAIFGNATFDYQSTSVGELDPYRAAIFENAEGNYWGTTDPLAIAAKVTLGGMITSRPVDFVPFLDAEGGQPVPSDRLLLGVIQPTSGNVRTIPPGPDVLLLGNILVPAGVTLEIRSNRVRAVTDQGIGVDGTLRLIGQAGSPVTITPTDPVRSWLGIDVRPGSTGSVIDHAVLEHTSGFGRAGTIEVRGSQLTLTNTQIVDFVEFAPGGERAAGVIYSDGATGLIQRVTIDNVERKSSSFRSGVGILLENSTLDVLDSTVREAIIGIHLYGVTTARVSGNLLTSNDIGLFVEGTRELNQNPTPRINGNSIFGNAAQGSGRPTENIVLANFGPGQMTAVDARGNFFGVTTAAAVAATIAFRGELPIPVDVSGFLASAGGPPVVGSESVFNTRLTFEGLSAVDFAPFKAETVTLKFNLLQTADVSVQVFDELDLARATPLRTFALGSQVPGAKQVVWNGRDAQGRLVQDGAYKFVIRATSANGMDLFDPPRSGVDGAGSGSVPSLFSPYQNDALKIPYSMTVTPPRPARINLVVRPNPTASNIIGSKAETVACRAAGTCFLPIEDRVLLPGDHVLSFDGRLPDGTLFSGPIRIDVTVPDPVQINAVVVRDSRPAITGTLAAPNIEVKSNPYLIVPTLDQQTSIAYCLDRQAIVTMKLLRPGFSDPDDPAAVVHVFENRTLQAGSDCSGAGQPYARSFGGLDAANPMQLRVTEDGAYTFVIDAEDPNNSTLRARVRGVVNILRSATR